MKKNILTFEDLFDIEQGLYLIDEHGRPMPGYYEMVNATAPFDYLSAIELC